MADSPDAIKKHQNLYLMIGLVLFFFTVVTVAVATVEALDFGRHGFDVIDCVIGLGIATFKASLVMLIFMHLNHEKKMIYWIFGGAFVFGIFLMWLTGWSFSDPIRFGKGDVIPTDKDSEYEVKTGFYNPDLLPSEIEARKD